MEQHIQVMPLLEQVMVQEITNMKYMSDARTKEDKLFDDPSLMRTPIVRNGKHVTVGYCPEIWDTWE